MCVKQQISDKQREMHEIVKEHSVEKLRSFLVSNPSPAISAEQLSNDDFLFDLMHVYKACLPYYGSLQEESLKYCLDKGIIKYTPEERTNGSSNESGSEASGGLLSTVQHDHSGEAQE